MGYFAATRGAVERMPRWVCCGPSSGCGAAEVRELEATLSASDADVVVEGTPIDLRRILSVDKPIANVRYELEELEPGVIEQMVRAVVE